MTSASNARPVAVAWNVADVGVDPFAGTAPSGDGVAIHCADPTSALVCVAVAERPDVTASMSGLFGAFSVDGLSSGLRSNAIGSPDDEPTVS